MSNTNTTVSDRFPSSLTTPWHRAIIGLLVNGAGDELTRNQLAATYLLSLRQLAGQAVSPRPPWLFFINGGTTPDPLIEVVRWNQDDVGTGMEDQTSERFRGTVAVMREAAGRRQRLKDRGIAGIAKLEARDNGCFCDNLARAFGGGATGRYAMRHDPVLGWMSSGGHHIQLCLEQDADHGMFRHDLRTGADRLMKPTGVNPAMEMTGKLITLSGSLDASRWDAALVDDMLSAQLPVLYIPHAAGSAANVSDSRPFRCVEMIFNGLYQSGRLFPVYPRIMPATDAYVAGCENILRARLAHCPANYDFFVRVTVREVEAFCMRLCCMLLDFGGPADELGLMHGDLTRATIRAITLGVESMAYHGVGVAPLRTREEVCQILEIIRGTDSITRRDLQRKHPALSANERDRVLHRMAEEGLIRVDGQRVTAVPLDNFIRSLADRPGLSAPVIRCAHLPDKWAGVKRK